MSAFSSAGRFLPNTSLLISHEATASLLFRASSSNKNRLRIQKRPKPDKHLAAGEHLAVQRGIAVRGPLDIVAIECGCASREGSSFGGWGVA